MNRRTRHPGFSLFELIMVLAIVGTMAAIVAPRYFASLGRYRSESAARRIVADLAYARSQAQLTGASKTVSFDVAADTYTLAGVEDPDHKTVPYVVSLQAEPYMATVISAEFDDEGDPLDALDEVIFDGYGKADSSGTVVVNFGDVTKTVELDGDSGTAWVVDDTQVEG